MSDDRPSAPDRPRRPRGGRAVREQRPTKVLTPFRWLPRGEAVATVQGRPVVIWKGIVGETAKVELTGRGQHQDHARFKWTRDPHPSRREEPCDRVDQCGACPLMHMEEPAQQQVRLTLIRDALSEFNLEGHTPEEVIGSPDGDLAYRHTIKLAFGRSDIGRIRVGAYGRHSHKVIAIPNCPVAEPVVAKVMRTIAHHVIDLDVRPYDENRHTGLIRHCIIKRSRSTGQILITWVIKYHARVMKVLAERVAQDEGEVAGQWVHINEEPGNAIFAPIDLDPEADPRFKWLGGSETIEEELAGVPLLLGPGDFFQVNPGTADRLVSDVVASLAPWRERPVVDLYCGVGAFTLPLAKAHGWAAGIEIVPGAVERAAASALRLHLNAQFLQGTVAEQLPTVARQLQGKGPVVVVDPARRGLDPDVHEAIDALKPVRLVYISCNPRALARDLDLLKQRGWKLERLRAYDMFPQTSHVEVLAELAPMEAPEITGRAPRRRVVRRKPQEG